MRSSTGGNAKTVPRAIGAFVALAALVWLTRPKGGRTRPAEGTKNGDAPSQPTERSLPETGARQLVTLFGEILALSLLANGVAGFAFLLGFNHYWGKLGPDALQAINPGLAGMGLLVFLLVLLGPLALTASIPLGFLSSRPGPHALFQKGGAIVLAVGLVCVIDRDAPAWFIWPIGILSILLLSHAYRLLEQRLWIRAMLAVGFLGLAVAVPIVSGQLWSPTFNSLGQHDGSSLTFMFDPSGLTLAQDVLEPRRALVVLGTTALGDPVVVDPCMEDPRARVVGRATIERRNTPIQCP